MNRGSLRKKPSSTLQKGKHFTNRPNDHKDDDRSEVIKEHVDQQRKTDRLDRAVLAFKVSFGTENHQNSPCEDRRLTRTTRATSPRQSWAR